MGIALHLVVDFGHGNGHAGVAPGQPAHQNAYAAQHKGQFLTQHQAHHHQSKQQCDHDNGQVAGHDPGGSDQTL